MCFAGATTGSSFGQGVGPIHNYRFSCSGSETNLLNCQYFSYKCFFSYHAGVKCEGNSNTLL